MQLFINDQQLEDEVEPTETILNFLRRSALSGTKEGCASGDCGACTVLVGRERDGKAYYETINACIAPVAQYADAHIVTVEGLAKKGELHPVQQAMVDCHGSQCGFCTPGFVMSLAALTESTPQGDDTTRQRDQVREAISGNLCRCTGYRPIVDAGIQALHAPRTNIEFPTELREREAAFPNQFFQPRSLTELNSIRRDYPQARYISGGTDLMLEVTQLYSELPGLIDLTHIPELQILEENNGSFNIGAAVSYTKLEDFFATRSTELVKLLHRLGSKQIRNSGSLGGNLGNGSPIADMPPILLAWDASLEIGSANDAERSVAVSDFYRGYRDIALDDLEYIKSVTIPTEAVRRFHRFYKNSKRIEDDISSVMGAFSFQLQDDLIQTARVAYGGMAATPIRLVEIEEMLVGNAITPLLLNQVRDRSAELLKPMTDVRASAEYRTAMALQMLNRALRELNGETLVDITDVLPSGESR